ncbi:MAG: 23S rRNA (pseudouridine(1915)-N(3))-methyltransferase RlmH [Bacteroidales bacterium]|nr:23S rRNA (pseudouridine(1915)-N(3))-methyltransferase RlmH [Bacteroidales bacterium]OJX83852.1 MAG: 23S rRNA (pseudouridine(1915)-N(3))-methyltransferase RlmH [Paludibacter sp. 47-17]
MKISVLMVGKTTHEGLQKLIQDYHQRLTHYIGFETRIIPELKNIKNLPVNEQKEKEADLILKQLEPADEVILLDEKGKTLTSVGFAGFLETKMLASTKKLVFVIGGPFGFSERVYQRADQLLSLSAMTFSHQMIRLLFAEQLYRAMTIIKGENYHHQ